MTHTDHGWRHVPRAQGGTDPIPLGPPFVSTGDDLEDLILLGPDLDAFWKLNETSGSQADDSSGNDWHLNVPATYSAPTWAQAAGPTGEVSAEFVPGTDDALSRTASPAFPAYSGDMTAAMWVNLIDSGADVHYLIGQGNPIASNGWAMMVGGSSGGGFGTKLFISIRGGGGLTEIEGNNALTTDGTTWYYLAMTRASGTFRMYVNGLVQTNTTANTMSATGGMKIGDLQDGGGTESSYNLQGLASYTAVWSRALTSTELLAHYEAGSSGGLLEGGLVWTSDGAGGASWEPGTIEVDY